MKSVSAVLLLLLWLDISCSEKKKPPVAIPVAIAADTVTDQKFFPVTDFIAGQIKEIGTLPVTPLMITTQKGKEDSVWVKREDIRKFVQPFLHPVIDAINLRDLYLQSSFLDQTINAVTFTYTPVKNIPDSIQLQSWDVYVDPQKGSIQRVYMVKRLAGNPPVTQQLTWQAGHWCKITTISELPGTIPVVREQKLIWDFND